jgi:hypothetical protein
LKPAQDALVAGQLGTLTIEESVNQVLAGGKGSVQPFAAPAQG